MCHQVNKANLYINKSSINFDVVIRNIKIRLFKDGEGGACSKVFKESRETFVKRILPIIKRYRKQWGCEEIIGFAAPHLRKVIERLSGGKQIKTKVLTIKGRKMKFIQLRAL